MLTYDEYAALSLTSSSLKAATLYKLYSAEGMLYGYSLYTPMPKSIDIKVVTDGGNFFCTYMCYFVTIWYCIGFMGRNSGAFLVYLHKEKLTKLWIK
jgi:hypothetical protein